MKIYTELKEQHAGELDALQQQHSWIGMLRLALILIAIGCFYFYITTEHSSYALSGIAALIAFPFVLSIHKRISAQMLLTKTLIGINSNELLYLERKELPFEDGAEYTDPSHPYSFDLDFFGKKSLFQHINRTATYIGKTRLAASLQTVLPNEEIKTHQEAIKELSHKVEWRQDLLARSKIANDNRNVYEDLLSWSAEPASSVPLWLRLISFVSPVLLFSCLMTYAFTDNNVYLNAAEGLFLLHLTLLLTQLKKIKHELIQSDKLEAMIYQYSLVLRKIETEPFESSKLSIVQASLVHDSYTASEQLQRLSSLFARMESIQNAVGSALLNGLFLYHIHSLHTFLTWKESYASFVPQWISVIGEIEVLNSFANFSYNNPTFVFPALNHEHRIRLADAGHPLIDASKRICNTVEFKRGSFLILTGSNMSGKSTFLRTLGVNMVLAGTGAPVCASVADIHPLSVIVSMRLSDSLSDSESYFFAEVKRLKQLMNTLDQQVCFVLLDEILRGTNSDDKRSGTIEVIKKIIGKQAIGAIATHDLEVCHTTDDYPDQLSNKCFEVEIINDELVFDYRLREGICKNKSATFLMKKMGVI